MSTDQPFDLPAAVLRADQAEIGMSVELLASSFEQALPGIATVERRKVGGFRSKRRAVEQIAVTLGDERFELRCGAADIACTRQKVVRGITLSRQQLTVADWIAELIAALSASAQVSERDRVALEGLLR